MHPPPIRAQSFPTRSALQWHLQWHLQQAQRSACGRSDHCRASQAYTPSSHSVREVRQWEQVHSRKWYELSPTSRRVANDQITEMKEQGQMIKV